MRLIFEQDSKDDSFEIVVSERELEQIREGIGAYGFVLGGLWDSKNLNVFLRKEKIGEFDYGNESDEGESEDRQSFERI